jgi:hypothetical protein
MPGTDEDVLRELMHRATADLHACPDVGSAVLTRQRRRHWRTRAVSAGLTGVAAGTAAGLLATSGPATSGGQPTGGGQPASSAPVLKLTAAQRAIYQLSSAAAQTPRPAGRYIALAEKDDSGGQISRRTSVFDGKTGEGWTFQEGAGIPATLPPERHASPTEAQLDALPTSTAALRAYLLGQARQQDATARKALARQLAKLPKAAREKKAAAIPSGPPQSNDDLIFGQATDMLWNPMVGPALRSALYKVLATTPGVQVNTTARDASGRRAIELSRPDQASGWLTATFENPGNGSVLESLWAGPGDTASSRITSLYQPVTSSRTFPGDPYPK